MCSYFDAVILSTLFKARKYRLETAILRFISYSISFWIVIFEPTEETK
jgi:hypothetical protein